MLWLGLGIAAAVVTVTAAATKKQPKAAAPPPPPAPGPVPTVLEGGPFNWVNQHVAVSPPKPPVYGPGKAPPPPWQADHDNPNATDCWTGENGNAHGLRWVNSQGVSLPNDVETWSADKVSQAMGMIWLGKLPAASQGSANVAQLAAEFDAMMIGCLGQKIWAGVKQAATQAAQAALNAGQSVWSEATSSQTSVSVSTSGGNVTVGGVTLGSW